MGSEQRDDGHYAYFEYAHDETLESLDIKGLDDRTRQSLVCQKKHWGVNLNESFVQATHSQGFLRGERQDGLSRVED